MCVSWFLESVYRVVYLFHHQSALFRLFIDIISSSFCLHHVFRYTSCMSCVLWIARTCVFFVMTYSYLKRNKSIPVTFGFASNINFAHWIIHCSSWLSQILMRDVNDSNIIPTAEYKENPTVPDYQPNQIQTKSRLTNVASTIVGGQKVRSALLGCNAWRRWLSSDPQVPAAQSEHVGRRVQVGSGNWFTAKN